MRALPLVLVTVALALTVMGWRVLGSDATNGAPGAIKGAFTSSMGPLEEGTNRQGRDIPQAGGRTDNALQCSVLCGANLACQAMSFAKDADGQGGICLLKSEVPSATENSAVTSAVKIASSPQGGR